MTDSGKFFLGALAAMFVFTKLATDNPGTKAYNKVLNAIQANQNAQVALFGRKTAGTPDVQALTPTTAVGWQALSAKAKSAGFSDISAAIDAFVLVM